MAREQDHTGYHHGNLREALISASLEILEREGLPGLGLRAVARVAGVSQTAPYHHFDGKEGLLAAVAASGYRRLAAEQERVEAESARLGRSPEAAVRELGAGYVRVARESPELFKLMFGPAIPDRDAYPELAEANAAAYSFITQATRRLLVERRGDASEASVSIAVATAWSTVHGLATLLIDGRLRPGEDAMPEEDVLVHALLGRLTVGMAAEDEDLESEDAAGPG